jgi:hypothetical protein
MRNLDGDRAVQFLIPGKVDPPEATFPQEAVDAIAADAKGEGSERNTLLGRYRLVWLL